MDVVCVTLTHCLLRIRKNSTIKKPGEYFELGSRTILFLEDMGKRHYILNSIGGGEL